MWLQIFAVHAVIILGFAQLLIEVVYSIHTDTNLRLGISLAIEQGFSTYTEVREVFINSDIDVRNLNKTSNIILDLASSPSVSEIIKDFTNKHQIIHISISNFANSYTSWQYFTHPTNMDTLMALYNFINFLNWNKFIVIFDEGEIDNIKNFKDQPFLSQSVSFFFGSNQTQAFSDSFIGKAIKPLGIRNIAILTQGESASKLISSLSNKNMMKEGIGIILGSRSWWDVTENGILGFTESGLESAKDYYSYEALACIKLMSLIIKFPACEDNALLRDFLDKNTRNHHPIPNFTVINTKNGNKRSVGTMLDGIIAWNDELHFIGNSSSMPNSPTAQVNVWIADGVTNPGLPDSFFSYKVKVAAHYAFLVYVEKTHFLDGFNFTITHTDCGAEVYEPTYSLNCFSKLVSKPGIAFMPTALPPILFGNLRSLKILNISMPVVSEYATPYELTSKANYPQFMRVGGYDLYHTSVLTKLINVFGWKNMILIVENSTENIFTHDYVAKWAEDTKVNIANKAEDRWIMLNYEHDRFDDVKDWMKRIIDLKIRPILFHVTPPSEFYLISDFYKAGLRQGDCVFLATNKLAHEALEVEDEASTQYLMKLLYGSLIIMQVEFFGDFGQTILKELLDYEPSASINSKCLTFDAAMLIVHGLKYSLSQGENFEDSSIFNRSLRRQKFVGCSGTVSIETDSNNRNSPTLAIYNIRWNDTSGVIYEEMIGTYSVESEQLFAFSDAIIWYNNKTLPPNDTIVYDNGCPFDKKEIRFSPDGAAIFYCLSAITIIIAMVATLYSWKQRWHKEYIEPIKKSLIQIEDYIVMVAIFVDFLQFLSLGPDFSYDMLSSNMSAWVSINIAWINNGDTLWIYVNCAVVIVAVWELLLIQIEFNLFIDLDNSLIFALRAISKASLTIVGNLGFLPLISVFLSSFACYESIGPSLKQTFVHQSCSTFCWQDRHVMWATLSIISLAVYLPSAIYFRPLADVLSNGNIKTKPLFLMAKGILQVSAIALSKALKVYYASLHGLIYILLFSIFIAFCAKLKPYNYNRINLWLIISYLAVIWGVSLSSAYSLSSYKYIPLWLSLNFIGWTILICVGVYFQIKYCHSMLFAEKKPDIGILFKFELGNSIKADTINQAIRKRRHGSDQRFSNTTLILESNASKHNLNDNKSEEIAKL